MTVIASSRHRYGPRIELRRKNGSKKFKSGKNRQKRIFPKIARFTGVHRKLQIKIPSTEPNHFSWGTFWHSQNISVIIWKFPKNYTILKKWIFFHVFLTFITFLHLYEFCGQKKSCSSWKMGYKRHLDEPIY